MRDYLVTVYFLKQTKQVKAETPLEAFALAFPALADTNTLKSVANEHMCEVKIEGFGARNTVNYYIMRADSQRQIVKEPNGLDALINQAQKECNAQYKGYNRRKEGREDR